MYSAPVTISTQTVFERCNTRKAGSKLGCGSVQFASALLMVFVISTQVYAGGAVHINSPSNAQLPRNGRLLIYGRNFGNQQGSSQLLLGRLGVIAMTWTDIEIHASIPRVSKRDQNNNPPKRAGAAYSRSRDDRRWVGADPTRLGDHRSM